MMSWLSLAILRPFFAMGLQRLQDMYLGYVFYLSLRPHVSPIWCFLQVTLDADGTVYFGAEFLPLTGITMGIFQPELHLC
jgi:hypothetical protein